MISNEGQMLHHHLHILQIRFRYLLLQGKTVLEAQHYHKALYGKATIMHPQCILQRIFGVRCNTSVKKNQWMLNLGSWWQ